MNPVKDQSCSCGSGEKFAQCCAQGGYKRLLSGGLRSNADRTSVRYALEESVAPEEMTLLLSLSDSGRYVELESAARILIKQYPYAGPIWKQLGSALKAQGKDALLALKKAAELLPNDAESNSNLAIAWQEIGQLEAALASCRRTLLIRPDYAQAHVNLGNILREMRQLDAAAASCRRALEIEPDSVRAHHCLGVVLGDQGRVAEAEASCRRALELDPRLTAAILFMAELQLDKGLFAEAEALFRRAIAIEPESPEAWAGIAAVRKMTNGDVAWFVAAQRIVERALPPQSEARLRFAIGKYCDDVGDYEHAFAHYRRANELGKMIGNDYNRQRQTLAVDVLARIYGRDWIEREQVDGHPSARPVFIVGMPCSGVSLVEKILVSHPAVHGAGELEFWKNAAALHGPSVLSRKIGEGVLDKLASDYLRLLAGFSSDAARVVDTMPDNFLHLGLIHAAFPNARIVHVQRNPIDTCLAIYFQQFNRSRAYANDLEDLAHFYTEYYRAMEHWRATLPEHAILHVPYENLGANPEEWCGKILDFVALPWDAIGAWKAPLRSSKVPAHCWCNYEKFVSPLQRLTDLGGSAAYARNRGNASEYADTEPKQLLGNILRRAQVSLRIDEPGDTSPLCETLEFHARRVAESILTIG